ncbi:hypothetical protein ACFLUV_06270 [Elusimicrobiota bacterium]
MISFEQKYFRKFIFSKGQIEQFTQSAIHDLKIAEEAVVSDVTFKFSYDALIKIGITLIAMRGYKVRSTAGHHIKILEKLSDILGDEDIIVLGDKMRKERNLNLYDGGFFVGDKDSREYLVFVENVFAEAGIRK